MGEQVKPIPENARTLTPYLRVRGAAAAIEFYKKAFGAEEFTVMTMPGSGGVMHAELRIGDSNLMLSDEFEQWKVLGPQSLGGTTVGMHLYVTDCDAAYARAVGAGATGVMPPTNMFWGDRFAKVKDPFGHEWSIATHVEDVSADECARRAAKMFGGA
jgi:PhnB protein